MTTAFDGLTAPDMRLVRGSHIVVPRLFDHDNAYIFQNPDRRIVFAIPYQRDFTMIGTTDSDFTGDLDSVTASDQEIAYLCDTANRFFNRSISPDDIVWSFAGVRPLLGDGSDEAKEVTRDYKLDMQRAENGSIALSVLGGKITTYRKLAEQALGEICQALGRADVRWTETQALPGGDFGGHDAQGFLRYLARLYPRIPDSLLERYVRSYGSRVSMLLRDVSDVSDLGPDFGAGLHEREVRYLVENEWARTPEDILWRRTKLGLRTRASTERRLLDWFKENGVVIAEAKMPMKGAA